MNSSIIKCVSSGITRLMNVIENSYCSKVFTSFSRWFKKTVKASVAFKILCTPPKESGAVTKNSFFIRNLSKAKKALRPAFEKVKAGTDRLLRSSTIIQRSYDFYSNLLLQPVSVYGTAGISAAASYLMFSYMKGGLTKFSISAGISLMLLSVLLVFGRTSLYTILYESRVFRRMIGEGFLNRFSDYGKRKTGKRHFVIPVAIGVAAAAMIVLLPFIYAAAGIGAILVMPVILIKPVIGVFILAPAIAFIPTTAAVGLTLFIWIGITINIIVGEIDIKGAFTKGRSVVLFAIVVLSGGILSFTPAISMASAAVYMVFISVVFQFIILVRSKDSFKMILSALTAAAAFAALYGIYQYMSGNIEVGWIDSEMFEGMKRIYSTFENPNVFGEYLLITIPFAMALFFGSKKVLYKALWLGAGGLMVIALVLTMSRGCWIGLAVGVFIYFTIADRRYLWMFPVAVLALPFILPQSVLMRLLSIGNLEDSSSLYRLYIWLGTLSMLKDYWITGVGLGTKAFSGIYSAYAYNGVPAPHAHNLYLQILSETGIAGLLSFAWLSLTALKNSISTSLGKGRFKKHMGAALAASLTGFFVQGVFDNVFYNYRIYLMFFMTVAITFAYSAIWGKGEGTESEKDKSS